MQPSEPAAAQNPSGVAERAEPTDQHAPTLTYAGRRHRLIAGLIDAAVAYAVALVVHIPLWGYHRTMHGGRGSMGNQIATDLIAVAIGLLYYALPHARWGQTAGKRLMSIRVVRADAAGAISYGQAAWRFVVLTAFEIIGTLLGGAFSPLVFLVLVDVAWILWDPRRQALHDKLAKTTVVRAAPDLRSPYARATRAT